MPKCLHPMKIKILAIIILSITILGSCSAPAKLPQSEEIHLNPYGALINIRLKSPRTNIGYYLGGELIAVEESSIIIVTHLNKMDQTISIPIDNIKSYTLKVADNRYKWMVPTTTAMSILHGWFLIITLPTNLAVSISTSASHAKAFKYNDRNLPYPRLRMFARFPQGLPQGMELSQIK